MKPVFFATAAEFRHWLEKHHATATELLVGCFKKSSGKTGLTYQESVDEALCFGLIDGVVTRIDDERYAHRFTPRRTGSIWSNINVAHVARLTAAGKMHAAGLHAFSKRSAKKTGVYAYEQTQRALVLEKFPSGLETIFRANSAAWKFWELQPPGYRKRLITWAATAKQTATREARLNRIIAASAAQKRLR